MVIKTCFQKTASELKGVVGPEEDGTEGAPAKIVVGVGDLPIDGRCFKELDR